MRILRPLRQLFVRPEMPPEIYRSVVDSIYDEVPAFIMGATAIALGIFFTAYVVDSASLYLCGAAAVLVGGLRAGDMLSYHRTAHLRQGADGASAWELRYTLGAVIHTVLMGVWCALTLQYDSALIQVFSMSITIACQLGIAARAFGSDRLVTLQVASALIPIVIGLYLNPDWGYFIFAFFLIPFFVSLRTTAQRLRRTLLDAIRATLEMSLLAKRFDTALNNMPHGLAMFDTKRTLVVANDRLGELLGLPFRAERKGQTVREVLLDCVQAGVLLHAQFESLAEDLEDRLGSASTEHMMVETNDGRTLDLAFQQMENRGGSVVLIEDITERRNAEARIRHLARYDALTGLPNRTFFHEQLNRVLVETRARGESCALLFVDLDQFKQVNDTLGHPSGDQLLCEVADRIKAIVDETDIVARFGGDEFVVLKAPISDTEQAAMLAGGLVTRLGETYQIGGHEVVIGASVGIAIGPRDGGDADQVLKNADMALYRAKADGRGAWRFFEAEMDIRARARRELELDLRYALATDAFQVFFQPLYNIRKKRISTCEALLRWPHPERGMVSPAEFIPVAEEMGLIVEIGNRVLHKACAECKEWPDDVRVAVNLSPIQFRRGNIPAVVREALTATGLPAHRLEIEITESVLFQDAQAARVALEQIREMGVRIALDDFGTGYSSLSYLHSFPLHKVKIDRSFITDLGRSERSLTLLKGVTRLTHELGMSVAVEGVETQEQLTIIENEAFADEAQGFLFSPAISSVQLRKLLHERPVALERVA